MWKTIADPKLQRNSIQFCKEGTSLSQRKKICNAVGVAQRREENMWLGSAPRQRSDLETRPSVVSVEEKARVSSPGKRKKKKDATRHARSGEGQNGSQTAQSAKNPPPSLGKKFLLRRGKGRRERPPWREKRNGQKTLSKTPLDRRVAAVVRILKGKKRKAHAVILVRRKTRAGEIPQHREKKKGVDQQEPAVL